MMPELWRGGAVSPYSGVSICEGVGGLGEPHGGGVGRHGGGGGGSHRHHTTVNKILGPFSLLCGHCLIICTCRAVHACSHLETIPQPAFSDYMSDIIISIITRPSYHRPQDSCTPRHTSKHVSHKQWLAWYGTLVPRVRGLVQALSLK